MGGAAGVAQRADDDDLSTDASRHGGPIVRVAVVKLRESHFRMCMDGEFGCCLCIYGNTVLYGGEIAWHWSGPWWD